MNEIKNKKQRPKSRLLQWTGTIVAILSLIYIILQQGWGDIVSAGKQISVWHLSGAMILMFCSRLAVAMRWYVLLKVVEPQISFGSLIRVTFAGLFASNFLPSTIGGDVIRLAGVVQHSIDTAVGTASLLIDRLIGMTGMFFMLPFAGKVTINELFRRFAYHLENRAQDFRSLTAFEDFGSLYPERLRRYWFTYNSVLGAGFLGNFKVKDIFKGFYNWIINSLKTCSRWYKHPIAIGEAFFFTSLHMLSLFGALFFLLRGLGDFLPLWQIGALWSLVYFVTLFPISINGYGLQEISITFTLTSWGGISSSHSIIVALLIRIMFVVASFPGAIFLPKIIASLDNRR